MGDDDEKRHDAPMLCAQSNPQDLVAKTFDQQP
jgi:hypothetical protein